MLRVECVKLSRGREAEESDFMVFSVTGADAALFNPAAQQANAAQGGVQRPSGGETQVGNGAPASAAQPAASRDDRVELSAEAQRALNEQAGGEQAVAQDAELQDAQARQADGSQLPPPPPPPVDGEDGDANVALAFGAGEAGGGPRSAPINGETRQDALNRLDEAEREDERSALVSNGSPVASTPAARSAIDAYAQVAGLV